MRPQCRQGHLPLSDIPSTISREHCDTGGLHQPGPVLAGELSTVASPAQLRGSQGRSLHEVPMETLPQPGPATTAPATPARPAQTSHHSLATQSILGHSQRAEYAKPPLLNIQGWPRFEI